jgi:hypothetical protein
MDIASGTRASDSERADTAELLARHLADGRLDLAEYDRRVAHAYAAVTRADLDAVLADLPARPSAGSSAVPAARRVPLWQRIELGVWAGVGALNLIIWAAVCLGVGTLVYPWPVWVIGPWGAVLLLRVLAPRRGARPHRRSY